MTAPASPAEPEVETARAWAVTWAAFAANFVTFGVLFSFGVYLTPIAESFETTTGPVSSLFSAAVLVYYLSGALGGRFGDRYGTRPVVAVGALTIGVALFVSAQTSALWQLYLVFPVVGIAVGCCYPPLIGAVGQMFERRRVLAMAIVLTGVGAGTWLMPSIARALIDDRGWRGTFEVWAVLTFVVIGVTAAVVAPRSNSGGPAPRPLSPRVFAGERRFRRLYVALVLVSPGFYAPLAFLNDYAVDEGVSESAAAWLVGIIGGATVVSRLVIGALGPRFDALRQYRVSYLIMTAGLVMWLVAGGSYPVLACAAALHGIGWAVWVTAAPLVLSDWYGVQHLGGVLGAFYTGLGLGALLGPSVSGFVIDQASYRWAIGLVVASNVLAIAAAATVARPPVTPSASSV